MEILIGKGEDCNYRINDDTVSRNHCKLIIQDNSLYILDMGSMNGTFVDRQKIQANTMVQIAPDTPIHLSGMVVLSWKVIRELMPQISSLGRTTMVSPEEIERRMAQTNQGPYHQIPQGYADKSVPQQPSQPTPQQQPPPPNQTYPPQQPPPNTQRNDILYAAHAAKSYVGSAFLAWIMYYIGFFIIGFILNLVYLNQASETQRVTGQSPSGQGCLQFLIFVHVVLPIILIIMIAAGAIHIGSGFFDSFRF